MSASRDRALRCSEQKPPATVSFGFRPAPPTSYHQGCDAPSISSPGAPTITSRVALAFGGERGCELLLSVRSVALAKQATRWRYLEIGRTVSPRRWLNVQIVPIGAVANLVRLARLRFS